MPMLVTCPQCEKRLKLRDGFPGGKLSCPVCSKVFSVPPPKERAARPAAAVAPAELPVVDLPKGAIIEPDMVPERARSATRPALEDERPRRRRRREDDADDDLDVRVRRGPNLWLVAGLPAGVVVLLAAVFIVVVALGQREARHVAEVEQAELARAAAEKEAAAARAAQQAKPAEQPKPEDNEKRRRPLVKRPAAPAPKVDRVLTVALPANDLVYDHTRGLIYAAIGNTAPKHGNTIAAIDPATGDVRWTVDVGSDPILLDISEDGQALWVGLGGAAAIQRVDLGGKAAGP